MIEVINEKVFHLYNDKISYILNILPNKHIGQVYFGKRISFDEAQAQYYTKIENKAAGSVKYSTKDSLLSLGDIMQAYPVFGTSDFREGAIDIYNGTTPLYLDFKFQSYAIEDKKDKIKGLPTSYSDTPCTTLIITLFDEDSKVELKQYYTLFEDSAVIARHVDITLLEGQDLLLNKAMSTCLELPDASYKFVHLSGGWLKERRVMKNNINQGIVSVGSLKGASGHQQNPYVALESLDEKEAYGMNIVYSGNFKASVEVDEWNRTRMMMGIHPDYFGYTLKQKQTFSTPEAIMSYSDEGLSGLARENAHFVENHIIASKWKHKTRPIVFNSWEASYFDFDENTLLDLAKKSHELGMECFVIDDGWFGHRDDDRSSLGDWFVDQKKFPSGLKSFAQKIHDMDMQLGMWFEPEMISPDSKLFEEHPDYALLSPNSTRCIARGQYVLDFTNPEVIENIFNQMCKIIDETHLDYIKWDYNRNITQAYSLYLEKQGISQSEFYHRNILGFYELYERLLTRYPDLLIEGCAGGGGRFDLGVLYYSPQIWVSDDTDAIERLKIQYGTALGYPMSALSNHVSIVPNHQVGRLTSLDMRYHVAMFGSLGYELNLNLITDEEKEIIKKQIVYYKEKREMLMHGTFYLMRSSFDSNTASWGVLSADKNEALVGFYRILARPNCPSKEYFKIPFVDEKAQYLVNDDVVISGSTLKHLGMIQPYQFNCANDATCKLKGDYQSFIVSLKKVHE